MLTLRRLIFFYKMKYDIKGHLFLRYIICLTLNLLKTFQECQHDGDADFS